MTRGPPSVPGGIDWSDRRHGPALSCRVTGEHRNTYSPGGGGYPGHRGPKAARCGTRQQLSGSREGTDWEQRRSPTLWGWDSWQPFPQDGEGRGRGMMSSSSSVPGRRQRRRQATVRQAARHRGASGYLGTLHGSACALRFGSPPQALPSFPVFVRLAGDGAPAGDFEKKAPLWVPVLSSHEPVVDGS
jgi:hypothetical protein